MPIPGLSHGMPGIPGIPGMPQTTTTEVPVNLFDSLMPNQGAAAGAAVPQALRSGAALADQLPKEFLTIDTLVQKAQAVADELDRARVLLEKYLIGSSIENPVGSVYDHDPIGDTINAIVDNSVAATQRAIDAVKPHSPHASNATDAVVQSNVGMSGLCLISTINSLKPSIYSFL